MEQNQEQEYALVLKLPGKRNIFGTNKGLVTIGRDPGCDLAFPECKALSRRHAEIFYENGNWYLMDKGSTNGTWLNGVRIAPFEKYELEFSDTILLANTVKLGFIEGGEPEEIRHTPLQQAAGCPPVL